MEARDTYLPIELREALAEALMDFTALPDLDAWLYSRHYA
jgi:hypothetical protein